MSDITMCKGGGCPFKDMCYRHNAPASEYHSYFSDPPFKIEHGKPGCDYFIGDAAEQFFITLSELKKHEGKRMPKKVAKKGKRNNKSES